MRYSWGKEWEQADPCNSLDCTTVHELFGHHESGIL